MTNRCRIYVDADACPVKEEISEIASLYPVDIFFIASYAHVRTDPGTDFKSGSNTEEEGKRSIYVDAEREEVDLYIVNHAQAGDIVVTQDHGLASLLSARSVYVLSPRGKLFLEREMDAYLFERYFSAKKRRAGTHVKGPRKMSESDRKHFRKQLIKILSINEGKSD